MQSGNKSLLKRITESTDFMEKEALYKLFGD